MSGGYGYGPRMPGTYETYAHTEGTEVKYPLAKARWAAVCWVALFASVASTPVTLGPVLWSVVGTVAGLFTLAYIMYNTFAEDDEGNQGWDVPDLLTGIVASALASVLCWAWWQWASLMFTWIPIWAQGPLAFVSLCSILFWGVMLVHLETRFFQDMVFASMEQEKHVWEAFGPVLGKALGVWLLGNGRRGQRALAHHSPLPAKQKAAPQTAPEQPEPPSLEEMFMVLVRDTGTLSRDSLVGLKLADGTGLSKGDNGWEYCVDYWAKLQWIEKTPSGWKFKRDFTAQMVLDAMSKG